MTRLIALLLMTALVATSPLVAWAAPVADITCPAPTTGGAPDSVIIKRGPGTSGPFAVVQTLPLPVTWPYTDTTIVGGQPYSYVCAWANAAGNGPDSLASSPLIPLEVPGQGGAPTVIIRFQ